MYFDKQVLFKIRYFTKFVWYNEIILFQAISFCYEFPGFIDQEHFSNISTCILT